MAKFKVGDRVKLAVDRFAIPRGTTGVIKCFGKDADKEKLDIAKKISKLEINSLSEITTSLGTLYDKMRLA